MVTEPVVARINGGDETVAVSIGETARVTTAVAPWEALAGQAVYTVDDPTVASVDSSGTIRGLSAGTTTPCVTYPACTATDTIKLVVSDFGGASEPDIRDDVEDVPAVVAPVRVFLDVHPVNHWAKDPVDYVVSRGIFSGVSETLFEPDQPMNRAMVAKVLHNLEDNPVPASTVTFTDVESASWYAEAVSWAAGEGLVSGYGNGLYGPNDPVTREQLSAILYRYAQSKGKGFTGSWMFLLDYADHAEVSEWAYEALCWMTMKGIVNGTGRGMLEPKSNATRAQVAAMIQRFCEAE